MIYKSFFHYKNYDDTIGVFGLPVKYLQVEGGTKRSIYFDKTDDISLLSEFEQARALENMIVYLAPTNGGKDRMAAVDLITFFQNNNGFIAGLSVERYNGKKKQEGIILHGYVQLKSMPETAYNDTLKVSLRLVLLIKLERGILDPKLHLPSGEAESL